METAGVAWPARDRWFVRGAMPKSRVKKGSAISNGKPKARTGAAKPAAGFAAKPPVAKPAARLVPETAAKSAKTLEKAAPQSTVAIAHKVRRGFDERIFDARPDRLDFRDLPYRPPLRSLEPRWPLEGDVGRFLPPYIESKLILDQGFEGACTGFGLACVINYLFFVRSLQDGAAGPIGKVSPRMLYELARRYDEWPGERYEGSSCRGALKGWHKHGVCADELWPYRTKDGDVRLLLPRQGWDGDAVRRPLGVYYRIDKKSVVDMQAAIREIGAIYVSARVHDGWDRVERKGTPRSHDDLPVIPPIADRKNVGGHAFALVGYNEKGFIAQNSWGETWGAGGFAVMPYSDWVAYGTDAWACALGVPQAEALQQHRIEALRWPSRSGRSLGFFDLSVRNPDNPPDDPWPIDRDFDHKPYQPWSTAQAYSHTLVTGNDGAVCITDLTAGVNGDVAKFVDGIALARPLAWLKAQATPRIAIYAHGGLNSEEASIDRIRVMAPYFQANGIYPLFLAWRTGPGETILSMLEDKFRSFFGAQSPEEMRAAGFMDDLAESRDRRVEELARRTIKGLWSEMRENAQRGAGSGRGLDLLAQSLAKLRDALKGKGLEVHLIGHSAGSILHGHLLSQLAKPGNGAAPVEVASCSLYAAACSMQFAVDKYLGAAKAILPSERIHLHYLSDRNEKDDYLGGLKGLHLYGKSLLYLVSRALDDERKMPLLGFERAVDDKWATSDTQWKDQWAESQLEFVRTWQAKFKGTKDPVSDPNVFINKKKKTAQAQHGSFDNNVEVVAETIERIAGAPMPKPIEWLDY
jgi:hypothetical protein